ncbi:4'-phosphopantetheinyl transferase superfamily protein [Algoriphagus sp. C2-6-M1]|uniref:4'-phosphopantetheinyl transferase family protein n=1 Tax=Algoriphagus persicinus TaxID=3108754 RepID=UPI002B3D990B|nr:4'-phosphopantetheinyl transferase superfamily protein [Algoriphagus sp. C2-6-M1]MEB2782617.1 4'-phosphopantetheinyl transferase superfamily protein [Algoriphagus sp. C2-6-M1]
MGKIYCDQIKVLDWSKDIQTNLEDTVQVYRASLLDDVEKIASYSRYLSSEELMRSKQFRNKIDSNRFIVGRAMVKYMAAKILNKDFESVEIIYTTNNKPIIDKEINFHFNLSHSGDYVVLAICKRWDIGIDIEYCNSDFKFQPILDYCMSEKEQSEITEDKNPLNTFLMYWTRKEAILKGTGIGILERLNTFSCLNGINFIPGFLTGIASQWMIRSFYIDKNYIVSLAHDSSLNKLSFYEFKI